MNRHTYTGHGDFIIPIVHRYAQATAGTRVVVVGPFVGNVGFNGRSHGFRDKLTDQCRGRQPPLVVHGAVQHLLRCPFKPLERYLERADVRFCRRPMNHNPREYALDRAGDRKEELFKCSRHVPRRDLMLLAAAAVENIDARAPGGSVPSQHRPHVRHLLDDVNRAGKWHAQRFQNPIAIFHTVHSAQDHACVQTREVDRIGPNICCAGRDRHGV